MPTATPASGPAGSRRFWVTVLCFAVANAAVWVGYDRLHRRALLEVRQSALPNGAETSGRPNFWWTFNLDVAPAAANDPPPGAIVPAVPGRWGWDGPRTLTFTPDAPLPKATNLTITLLPERLHTPDGFGLKLPYITCVHTPPLRVLAVNRSAFDESDRLVLDIEFNDDVLPADAIEHITVHGPDRKPIGLRPHGDAPGHIVRVMTDPIPDHHTTDGVAPFVTVEVSPGLRGRGGPLALTSAFERNVPLGSELAATGADAYFSGGGNNATINLHFNNPVDLNVLKPLLSVTPAVNFSLREGYQGAQIDGPFQPATRYAIRIASAGPGVPPNARPRPTTLSVFVPDRSPSVRFEHAEGYLGSAGNRTVRAHAVNVTTLRASVTRVYDNNLVVWRTTGSAATEFDRPIATRDIKVHSVKNKEQDVRLSLDELLPAEAPRDGVYLLRLDVPPAAQNAAAEDEDGRWDRGARLQDSAMLTLSDIGLSAKRGHSAVSVWATSLRTAAPQPNVRVRLYSTKNQFLGSATTDANGLATIVPSPVPAGEEPAILLADRPGAPVHTEPRSTSASSGRDLTWLDLRSSAVSFGESETGGAPYLRTGHEAFLYTDRGVYRPGETVHLRAIVRGLSGATPPSFPVRWQFRRPDLHDWKSINGMIDSDGAVALDLPLPDDLPTGRWSVALGLPGQSKPADAFGSLAFQVEEFVPSRMQVGLTLKGAKSADLPGSAARFFVENDPLTAEVQADYLFGKPVSEQPVQLVARIDPIPFASPQWNGWTFGDAASTVQTLDNAKITGHRTELPEQQLDAKGHAVLELDLASLIAGDDTAAAPARSKAKHRGSRRPPSVTVIPPAAQGDAKYVGPWRLSVVASVVEPGGRAVSASSEAQLDPAPWYIAVRPRAAAATIDGPNTFDLALVAPDGKLAAEDVKLEQTLYRESWNNSLAYEDSHYVYHSTRLLEPAGNTRTIKVESGLATIDLRPTAFGSYVLRVRDPNTGGMTSLNFYAGEGAWEDNISRENPEKLELIVRPMPTARAVSRLIAALKAHGASLVARAIGGRTGEAPVPRLTDAWTEFRRSMFAADAHSRAAAIRPGDTAQVIVRSPFAGRLLLSVETDDVVTTRVLDMPASHVAIPVVLPAACLPNAYVTATVLRAVDPDAAWQTHRAIGTARVSLDNSDRKLHVELAAPTEIRPATSLDAAVQVTDAGGNPVPNAAVTIAAVDEGICQLTGFKTPDPFAFFTRIRSLSVSTADLFGQLMPEVPAAGKVSTVGGDADAYDPRHVSPVSAKRVKPVALVSGVLHTDASGIAHTSFAVPRFTGKLRLMSVASAGSASGSAESAVHVRSPILVQSSWPRFAAPGDRFQVALTLFNNSPAAAEASVKLHVIDGPIRFDAGAADASLAPIRLPAKGQATRFVTVTVGKDSGVSHATLLATAGNESYEEQIELPVRPASPEMRLGGYAVATPAKPAEISLPGGMLPGTEHFEVRATPWPSLDLPKGLDYLDRYPYGCLEQTTSTLFPLVYLSDIGTQIAPGLFEKQRVDEKVQVGITRLIGMQTTNGGLSMWPGYREPWPWGTVYAAHFLIEAQHAGHKVPEEFRKSVLGYVRGLLNANTDEQESLETQAYACYVLALAGKPDRSAMSRLSENVRAPRADGAEMSGQARLHLAAAWLAAGRRDLAEGLIPQALPQPRSERVLSGSLGSPVRDRAILLDTLLSVQPENPALPDIAQRLADAGRKGQWRSTQDTTFAVLALGRYLRQNKGISPFESAELRMGESRVGETASGKPLTWDGNSDAAGRELLLSVTGPADAKAHVAWLAVGVPLTPPPPQDHGVRIRRRLLDSQGKPLASPRVHSGDLVQVELSIASDTPLEHLAIDDLLPAGLEIENPRLQTTAADATEKPKDGSANIFEDARLDMRDDRLILIGRLTAAGTGKYVYTARAVTPGTFVLPPARVECMYDTATNSLGETGSLEVSPAGSPTIANVNE